MGTDFEDFIDLFFRGVFATTPWRCVRENHDGQIVHLVVGSQLTGGGKESHAPDSRFQGLIRLS